MKRISILEDDTGIREVMEMIFITEDFEVSTFASVSEFMSRKCAVLPDIFLLDVMLPDGNGLEVCNILKSAPESGHLPVIMMSAHAQLNDMRKQSKADAFISKPFDILQLIALVNESLLK